MSAMQPYDEYKESTVEWLGGIPAEWDLLPMFTVARESKLSNKGMVEDNLLSLSYGRIKRKDIETLGGLLPESFETYQVVNENDQIFRLTDLQNDKRSLRTAICTERGIITSAYVAVTPFKIDPRFYNYLMRAYDENKVFYNLGSGMRQSLKYDELKRLPLVVPPNEVQQQIVAFLDRETARIDNLISEKQNFINLLREKRQALISHVVTKGLNPDVKMKDSGVEWIGDVPEHWAILKFSHFVSIRNGQVDPTVSPWDEYTLIAPNHIESKSGKIIARETAREQGADSGKYLCKKGEVIYSKIRPALAKACVCEDDTTICSADMYPMECDNRMLNEYLLWLILSEEFTRYAVLESDRVAMPKINRESLAKIRFPVPPVTEQLHGLDYIKQHVSKVERIIEETLTSVELLKEHRTALISAAVTGKIDVRNQA